MVTAILGLVTTLEHLGRLAASTSEWAHSRGDTERAQFGAARAAEPHGAVGQHYVALVGGMSEPLQCYAAQVVDVKVILHAPPPLHVIQLLSFPC